MHPKAELLEKMASFHRWEPYPVLRAGRTGLKLGTTIYTVSADPDTSSTYYLCLKKWQPEVPFQKSLLLGVTSVSQSSSLELNFGSHKWCPP